MPCAIKKHGRILGILLKSVFVRSGSQYDTGAVSVTRIMSVTSVVSIAEKKSMLIIKMLFLMPKILTSWLVRCWEHYTCDTRIELFECHPRDTCDAMLAPVLYCELGLIERIMYSATSEMNCETFWASSHVLLPCFDVCSIIMWCVMCCVHSCRQLSTWSMLRVSTAFLCLLNSCVFLPAEEI